MQPASASSQYGILGRQAPELELDNWIDGNGKPKDPVGLKDYRGKLRKNQLEWHLKIPMAHASGNPQTHQISTTMRQYRAGGTPWTVLIDPKGTVVYNHFHIEPPQATAIIDQLLAEYIALIVNLARSSCHNSVAFA